MWETKLCAIYKHASQSIYLFPVPPLRFGCWLVGSLQWIQWSTIVVNHAPYVKALSIVLFPVFKLQVRVVWVPCLLFRCDAPNGSLGCRLVAFKVWVHFWVWVVWVPCLLFRPDTPNGSLRVILSHSRSGFPMSLSSVDTLLAFQAWHSQWFPRCHLVSFKIWVPYDFE